VRPLLIMVGVNVLSGVMIMIVMVIMLENRHPDLVSAAATGGTHLSHLHAH
jgi:homoserine kinase